MSTYNRELSYDQEIETVKGIKFSVLSPEEITRRSVVEVTKNDTFSGSDPIVGGLFDPRMGVLETNRTCSTCQQKNLFCPGHFGHIVMARPIYNPMFFDTVRKLLKCVCCRCSRPLVSSRSTREDIRAEIQRIGGIANLHKRWDALMKLHTKMKLKRCGDDHDKNDEENSGCQAVQPSRYQKESSGMKIIAEWKVQGEEGTQCEFTAEDILRIFKRITEDDMKLMGFDPRWNKPEWMICTVLPVPPPSVRPSIIEDSGQRREDDLTHKLCDIIKYNNQLKQKLDSGKANEENIKVLTNLVQYHVATFIDNQIPGMPVAQQRNGRKLKSIADRLKKKEGRIRGNLNGKRVDQSARSVITPDPYISLDELGVPLRIAMNLTFPEVVNRFNIVGLRELVKNGVDEWPGAKYVRRASDGITISLKYADRDEVAAKLQIGDTVDRHMMDADYVLFNRQPSLHKMSMMGFKVRVMQYQTFRLPVLSTGCFNADFDGDEMNLFNPQNVQTASEIMDITAIPFLVLNPRDGKPIVEVIQDTMVGSFRLTKDWALLSDKTMANLQMVNSYFDGTLPPPNPESHMYTGKQAFSEMLPPGLFISMTNKAGEKFVIDNSMITSGTVDKSVFHSMSKGIIPVLYHDYSPFEVRRFLDNTQRLMCRWLTIGGFSVGISDIIVGPEMNDYIRRTINENKKKAYEKFQDIRKGTFDNSSIFSNEENFEREMRDVLNALNKELGRVKLDEQSNRMINMIKSGSKGKEENVAQMVAAVGQQNVDGKRVSYGFTDRTLPHYTKYDDGPESRGFVENSFINGLTPQEVFFHAMGGREGLIDTAVRTSETGYIQRRLVKAMEDAKVYYDQTVRNATGALVQYLYGEDGMDGTKIEKQFIPYITMNVIEMDNLYHLRPEDPLHIFLTEKAFKAMGPPGGWYKRCKAHFDALLVDRRFLIEEVFQGKKEDKIQYPIPFERIINNAVKRLGDAGRAPTDLTPTYILDKIDDLITRLRIIRENQGIRFLHILLRIHLSPKVVLMKHNMSQAVFDWVAEEIERKFIEAVVHPGEMVGVIAAQSIGELGTQQTLDSFHSSGTVAAVKATSGVSRLKELLNVSKNIKTPAMFIYMMPDIGTIVNPIDKDETGREVADPRILEAKKKSIKVKMQLEMARIADILDSTDIYWDPPGADGLTTGLEKDNQILEVYRAFAMVDPQRCRSTSPWVLRININKEKLFKIGLTMLDIYTRLIMAYNQQIDCVFSDDNADDLVFIVRLMSEALKDVDNDDTIAALKAMEYNLINSVLLKGTKGIKKVAMRPVTTDMFNSETDQFDSVTEWILDTDGTNLQEILANPNVDATRTRSNDVCEILNVLGIEAARNVLHHEFTEVVGSDALNYRHMSMLLDTMTNRGTIMSVDRHGINRGDIGPLAKSSFEETTDMLVEASIFSQYDNINGVSANIMLGQVPPCGTGDPNIYIDEKEYVRLVKKYGPAAEAPEHGHEYVTEVTDMTFAESCSSSALAFTFNAPKKEQNPAAAHFVQLPKIIFK